MRVQSEEIIAAARAAFEQNAIDLGHMPDDDTWGNLTAEQKQR